MFIHQFFYSLIQCVMYEKTAFTLFRLYKYFFHLSLEYYYCPPIQLFFFTFSGISSCPYFFFPSLLSSCPYVYPQSSYEAVQCMFFLDLFWNLPFYFPSQVKLSLVLLHWNYLGISCHYSSELDQDWSPGLHASFLSLLPHLKHIPQGTIKETVWRSKFSELSKISIYLFNSLMSTDVVSWKYFLIWVWKWLLLCLPITCITGKNSDSNWF